MKTLIALIATVAASSAFAASTQDFGCYELRAKLNSNGILILDGKRYVADPSRGSFAADSDYTITTWVKTADFANCPVNTVVSERPNQSLAN